jgi:hypothetical protein
LVLFLAASVSLLAQRRQTGSQLRALAVVEFPETGKPRLIPVTILVDGRYYDAGIYKASPVPMSLDPGTVYEARKAGEPAGLFVVTTPAQLRRNWIAGGDWKPQAEETSEKKQEAPQPTGAPVDADAPPVLRRGSPREQPPKPSPQEPGSQQQSPQQQSPQQQSPQQQSKTTPPAQTPAPSSTSTTDENSDGPPVLRRPAPEAAPKPAPAEKSASAQQPAQASAHQSSQPQTSVQDPNRPRLRRNPEATPSQVDKLKDALPSPEKASWRIKEAFTAVSDSKEDEVRDYRFDWRPEEKERLQNEAEALASSALKKYAEARAHVAAGTLEDVQVQAFNLDFSNIPYIVLSATARAAKSAGATTSSEPNAEFRFHVTIIARQSPTQELRQVLAAVTDTSRLDVFPELQLVDAVDADGDGRAELLFAEISDMGRAYKLYRLIGDNATELFTSVPIQNSTYHP